MKRHLAWSVVVAVLASLGPFWPGTKALAQGPRIVVEDAWARPLPPVTRDGEMYMTIRNTGSGPDRLVAGHSRTCGMVELFERYRTAQGAMSMRALGAIDIPGGQRVELKVGGFHLMCMDRKQEFQAGARFTLTLKFEKSGDVPVQVAIRDG